MTKAKLNNSFSTIMKLSYTKDIANKLLSEGKISEKEYKKLSTKIDRDILRTKKNADIIFCEE